MQTPSKPPVRDAAAADPPSTGKVFRGRSKKMQESDPLWEHLLRQDCFLSFSCDRLEESLRMLERLNAKAPAGELPAVQVKVEALRNGARVLLGESGGTNIGKSRGTNVALPPANISMALLGPEDYLIITVQAGGIVIGAKRWSRDGFLREWQEMRDASSLAPGESLTWKLALHTNTGLLDKFSSAAGPMQMLSPVKSPGPGSSAADSSSGGSSEADAAVADLPADPATAVFIVSKIDLKFKNAGALALSAVSIEGLKAAGGGSEVKLRVTSSKDGGRTLNTVESAASKSPLPNASWGKEGTTLDAAVRVWLEPESYSQPLQLAVVIAQEGGSVVAMASVHLSQLTVAAHVEQPLKLTLTADGKPSSPALGMLNVVGRFFPAGVLQISLLEANDVTGRDVLGQSCFGTLEIPSRAIPSAAALFQTEIDEKCGSRPIWKENRFSVFAVHQTSVLATVHTQDLVGGNENLGSVRVDLASVYREGQKDAWLPITRVNRKTGQVVESGSVHVKARFFAPLETHGLGFTAVTFPQNLVSPSSGGLGESHGATVDFDAARLGSAGSLASSSSSATGDSKPATAASATSSARVALVKAGSPAAIGPDGKPVDPDAEIDDEEDAGDFTPEEIEAAFDYIDLDGNKMVGFMEIKHLLACMGELITDEEVDMMIRMCDPDGKGLLNFFDIYALAKHPNPSAPKFNAKRIGNKLKQRMRAGETTFSSKRLESTALAGGEEDDDYVIPETYRDAKKKAKTAEEIQAENKARIEQKRRRQVACAAFVNRYTLRLPQLKQILGRAEQMNAYKRQEGHLNFVEMCRLYEIDPHTSPEAQELFDAYVHSGPGSTRLTQGKINLREVLLACCAFSHSTFQQRARFVFDMFDEDGSGTLSIPELVEIMKANHFSSDIEAAKRRLAVILCESKRTGEALDSVDLSISDFMQLSKLFPNVVFPPLPANIQMGSALQGPIDFPEAFAAGRRDSLGEDGVGEGAALKLAKALAAAEAEDDEDLADAIKAGAAGKMASSSLSLATAGAGSVTGKAGKLAPLNRSPVSKAPTAAGTATGGSSAAQTTDSNPSTRPSSSGGAGEARPGSSGASRLFGGALKGVKGLFGSPSGKIAPANNA